MGPSAAEAAKTEDLKENETVLLQDDAKGGSDCV